MAYEFPSETWPIEAGDRSAESHLNALKEITAAVNFGWWLQNRVWDENSTGAIAYAPQGNDSMLLEATTVPSMQVKILAGAGFLAGIPFRKTGDTTLPVFSAPSADPRIDTIGWDPAANTYVVYEGTEASSPSAPSVASGVFKVGEIYLRVGSLAIYDSEQSFGGYIQNLRTVFSLPGDEPHTTGLTVSGGALVLDGSSGDITLAADGLSMAFNYAGEVNIDAATSGGFLVFRTGGSTDRLTLGTAIDPIILHGSSHDLQLSANGEELKSIGPNRFDIAQANGTGVGVKTDSTLRLTIDENGLFTFIGSLGNVALLATGAEMDVSRAGDFHFKATNAAGAFGFIVAGETNPGLYISSAAVQVLGDGNNSLYFHRTLAKISNEGEDQFVINQSGATDGIMLQTAGEDRYQINEAGQHDFWGDAYFHNDVYILGTLYIDGVPITGEDLPGGSAYGTISLPGTVFEPATSGGSAGPTAEEFGTNVLMFQAFADGADGYCMAPNVLAPLNWNAAQPVHMRIRWSADDTTTDTVRFLLSTAPQGADDSCDEAMNAATSIVDANESVADEIHVTPWTVVDVTGIAAGDHFALRLDRTATQSLDTLGATVRVHSVDIRYSRGST